MKLQEGGGLVHISKLGRGSWNISEGRWEEDDSTFRGLSTRKWIVSCRCQTCQSLMGRKAEDALEVKGRVVMVMWVALQVTIV